ncbi:ATP-binding protein [Candidatus Vondammii sp. HM_W22]|uniref:ATP-binding protein n=1 Tax=Candidatus Vondammii sp. HM_W22 TaxID=2687299 RepID=UPI00403D6A62
MKLAGFDFIQSQVNEELITALHHCEFIEEAQSIVFVGPGTDKLLLATIITVQAFTTIINLFAFYRLLSWLNCWSRRNNPVSRGQWLTG